MAIKILIGGSPCTYWSIAQKNNREIEASGMGWELFKNYLIAKEKFKPDFFLYENNKSAAQAIKDQIAKEFGVGVDPDVRFTYINSALVSAQNRQRFYVTNFGDIEQPEDRGILLKDILETGDTDRDKARCVTASVGRTTYREYLQKQQNTMACEPVRVPEYGNPDKSRPIRASYAYKGSGEGAKTGLYAIPVNITKDGKSQTIKAQYQQTSPANILGYSSTYGASGVAEPVGYSTPVNTTSDGKSIALKAQYYKDNVSNFVVHAGAYGYKSSGVAEPIGYATPVEWDENGNPTKAISCADGKICTVYEVTDQMITIRGKQYPIKLVDGYYIIRKLTVKECARLQTMPDDYYKAVSDSQAYKALGNGWTAEVIIHLLNHALKDIPRDEEIIVLSLYDGIATGRYCLDKMGFTNVKYHAYEIDKYPIMVAMDNYPDIIQHGDAFAVREDDWKAPQTRSEWLDELLGA